MCEIISDEICWTLDFKNVQPGDRFKVLYEAKYLSGEFVGVGDVASVYFNHLELIFMLFHTMIVDSMIISIRMVKTYESFSLKHPLKTVGSSSSLKIVFISSKTMEITKEQIMLQHT